MCAKLKLHSKKFREVKAQYDKQQKEYTIFKELLGASPDGFLVIDKKGEVLLKNTVVQKLVKADEALFEEVKAGLREFVFSEDDLDTTYRVRHFEIDSETIQADVYIMRDATEEREKERELEQFAIFDMLTGALTRYAGMDILYSWIAGEKKFTLCFIDMDNLKYVNDTFGHAEGDTYIIDVANLLKMMGDGIEVTRLGGDEFMVLIPEKYAGKEEQMLAGVQGQLEVLTKEFDKQYESRISYGFVASGESEDPSLLLSLADERMYECKRKNKKRYN